MARLVRSLNIRTRGARARLKPRQRPYWCLIGPGLALGYRKAHDGGGWIAYRYQHGTLDLGPADAAGRPDALSYAQALQAVRDWAGLDPASPRLGAPPLESTAPAPHPAPAS